MTEGRFVGPAAVVDVVAVGTLVEGAGVLVADELVGLAVPLVTFAEMVVHQVPPSPLRWKTLSLWVLPRV